MKNAPAAISATPRPSLPPSGSFRTSTEKPENTTRVTTSCMVLGCAAEYTALPQRLAGTASQYSKNAMPQLTMMTSGSGLALNFRWPYHAKVMKTLEANSIRIGNNCGEMVGISVLSKYPALTSDAQSGFQRGPTQLN